MSEVIPAIIPKSFADLNEKLSLVKGIAPLVQIDILDGKLTPEKSWPNIRNPDPDFVKIIREEEGFPFWEDFEFEFDLMVMDPEAELQQWISAGAKRIIIHYESFESDDKFQSFVEKFSSQFGNAGSYVGTELGVALGLDTANDVIAPLIEKINFVQCMGIAKIGFQGQLFDERVIEKIKNLRQKYKELPISVDGGVNLDSAPKLVDAGVTRLVVGSAIFNSGDIQGTIEELKSL